MWSYVFLLLRRQKGRSILVSGGFLLAACALILLSATTQATVLTTNQIIGQNWRPTYDLVVLPPQARVPQGQVVPADLLEGYNGGISIGQYQQIQQIPGVEVAAPIAFLGYVQLPVPAVQFSTQGLPEGYYKVDWTLTAFDGHRQIVERHEQVLEYFLNTCDLLNSEQSAVEALQQQHILAGECGPGSMVAVFPSVESGTFLLAAIDPLAENQLVHLAASVFNGRMLSEQDTLRIDPQIPATPLGVSGGTPVPVPDYDVPLLLNTPLPGQITLKADLTRIASNTLDLQQVVDRGGSSYLQSLPEQTVYKGTVPLLQNNPQGFSNSTLVWDGHNWQAQHSIRTGTSMSFLYTPSGLNYQPVTAPAGQSGPAYRLVPSSVQNASAILSAFHLPPGSTALPSDKQGPEVFFRTLQPLSVGRIDHPPYRSALYYAETVGQFHGQQLSTQFSNALNWLPENTYTPSPVVLRYDAQGQPVAPANLIPTTNPAGFTLQPPLALTTLAAAQRLKGNNIISSIRIRVAGVDAANQASWTRVEQVAAAIQQRTGLHVLVTLGSSPRPTLVYVPGLKQGEDSSTRDIEPLGWVEERWIYVGAGIVYLNQSHETQNLLLGAVLLVCLGYLMVTLSALVAGQRRDFAILSALGWRPWHPARLFVAQALIYALVGGVVGIGLALLLTALIGGSPPWLVVAWALPLVLGLAFISALFPLWQLWHLQPAEVLRAGTTVSMSQGAEREHARRGNALRLLTVSGMAVRNLMRGRVRALIALGSLFLSAVLLLVMADGLLAFRQTLQGTLLGNYVLLQTAVPQLAGAAFAVLLTFLSVADLLLLQVRERNKEIGLLRAVGWRTGVVQRLFMQEGLTLALLGAIPGVLVALAVLAVRQQAQQVVPTPLLGLGTVVLLVVVAMVAAVPAVRAANRVQVVEVLRAE